MEICEMGYTGTRPWELIADHWFCLYFINELLGTSYYRRCVLIPKMDAFVQNSATLWVIVRGCLHNGCFGSVHTDKNSGQAETKVL